MTVSFKINSVPLVKKITIRTNILSNFLALIIITAGLLIGIQYRDSEQMAINSANQKFTQLFRQLDGRSMLLIQQSHGVLNLLEEDQTLQAKVHHDRIHPARTAFIKALELHRKSYAIYLAHPNGDFFEVVNMLYDPVIPEKLGAPKGARWGIIKLSHQDQHQSKRYQFLDASLQVIASRQEETTYNPVVRSWYQQALKTDGIHRTNPYMFTHLQSPGITFSKRIGQSDSVIAIDHTALQMARTMTLLKPTADSDIFVFNQFGQKLLESKPIDINDIEQDHANPPLEFTEEEQAFIEQQPQLLVSNQLNWAPFDYVENGLPKGYSPEYMRLIAKATGLKFKFVNDYTFDQILENFEKNHIDILHAVAFSEDRARYGQFTDSYHQVEYYFITHKELPEINSYSDFYGKTLAVVKGWKFEKFIQQVHPQIKLQHYPDALSAMRAVEIGMADAVVDTMETYALLMKKYAFKNLEINQLTPEVEGHNPQKLYLMLQPGQPLLTQILNKAIAHINQYQQDALMQKWHIGHYAKIQHKNSSEALFLQLRHYLDKGQRNQIIELNYDGKRYLAMYDQFSVAGEQGQYLGIIVPFKTLMAPYMERIQNSILFALVAALLVIPLAIFSTGLIVRPIKDLMIQNEKIKQRHYDEIQQVDTSISELQELSESMDSLAHSVQAYQQSQEQLLDGIIQLIADAVDVKSPYTGGHCRRVPELACMLLDQVNQDQSPLFKHYSMTDKTERRAFEIGAWLHDCGKITTPEYVVDKGTKLETLYNRIHEIRTRFEVLWRDADIEYYQAVLEGADAQQAEMKRQQNQHRLQQEFALIAKANIGGEFMDSDKQAEIREIGKQTWLRHFDDRLGLSELEQQRLNGSKPSSLPATEPLLADKTEHLIPRHNFDYDDYHASGFKTPVPEHLYNQGEISNLCIERGTLSEEERFKINEHVIMTIKMLEKIPFPEGLENIPAYAGTHHETLRGDGYPRQLKAEDLSIPERIMVIADIFEALTASDRPYKPVKTLSESLKIMSFMRNDEHIDAELFELFLRSGVYLQYAQQYLNPQQIDQVDINSYLQ